MQEGFDCEFIVNRNLFYSIKHYNIAYWKSYIFMHNF